MVVGAAFNVQADIRVAVTWSPNYETDLAGYNLYRSITSGSEYGKVNSSLIIKTDTPQFVDRIHDKVDNIYYYVVTAVDNNSNESTFSNETDVHIDTLPPSSPHGIKKVHIK